MAREKPAPETAETPVPAGEASPESKPSKKGGKSKPAAEGKAVEARAEEGKAPAVRRAAPKAAAPAAREKAAEAGSAAKSKKRGHPPRKPSKRFRKAVELQPKEPMPVREAVTALKRMGTGTKFDQTVNIVMWLGIDPKQADQAIRGAVSLPRGIGKTRRVICFVDGDEADTAKSAGAIEAGGDELIKRVSDGWMDFDVAIAHPRMMGKVGKLGRVLGPSGKMPTPKNGTVTPNIDTAVKEFAAGKVEFRNDTGGNVHGIVGKMSFAEGDLTENIEAFMDHIRRMKPQTSKGAFIKKVCISGTMTPSVELKVGV